MKLFLFAFVLLFLVSPTAAEWQRQNVETKAGFRGLSVVDQKVIWASGTGGTVIKSVDGGKSWSVMKVPGAEKLDFRDIEAFDEKTAYILSIGNGDTSRIYKTTDGGGSWELQYQAKDKDIFLDAFGFWDRNNGIAMGDPIKGYYFLLRTNDGGKTWNPVGNDKQFPAKEGEAAFAASGTCLIVNGKKGAFMVSGGNDARVFRSDSRGNSWLVSDSPIVRGTPGSGIFSIAMFNANVGVIVGGNYEKAEETKSNLAFTVDGGKSWKAGTGLGGYRSGVAYVDRSTLITVGSSGSDISRDGGKSWKNIDKDNYNAVAAKGPRNIWAVGPNGLVSRYLLR